MPAGRPTKYSDEILEKTKRYLVDYDHDGSVIPSVAGLGLYLDVSKSVIYKWAAEEDKQEFMETLARIQQKQEALLLSNGLKGEFNSTITKLALANHGYSEKTEQTLQGPGGGSIEVNYVGVSVSGRRQED